MSIFRKNKNYDEENVDSELDLIRNALAEIKSNPNIETVAHFNEDGSYEIKKIREVKSKRASFLEGLKHKPKQNESTPVYPVNYESRNGYKTHIQDKASSHDYR